MAILLGIVAAITYGGADFIGGVTTRRSSALAVVLLSELAGLLLLVPLVPAFGGNPAGAALLWGAASGLAGALGVVLLYRGLALGRMAIVAPITAVEAAAVPVCFGLLAGERPSGTALAGVAVALGAITLVSSSKEPDDGLAAPRDGRPGVKEAFGAGLAFGAYFILLERAGESGGLWPLLTGRTLSIVVIAALVVVNRTSLRTDMRTGAAMALAGLLDVTANIFYLLALREGLLALVAVITSMYPASTVVLARVVLKERFQVPQLAGLALAVAGVALMAYG